MKLSEFKTALNQVSELVFLLPEGMQVPAHFHVTEIGKVNKHFIDCGGTIRDEAVVNFQLWVAEDIEHRLAPGKLLDIIRLSEEQLGINDAEIEVEHQGATIGKYDLSFDRGVFRLQNKFTDCLAKDKCGVDQPKKHVRLSDLNKTTSCCSPESNCC
ncbi:MAG: hypothetical protein KDD41_05055 [Flavobacteriales bacterium]|nr:hypothetical protein [Flavobacteriales bacterium]